MQMDSSPMPAQMNKSQRTANRLTLEDNTGVGVEAATTAQFTNCTSGRADVAPGMDKPQSAQLLHTRPGRHKP